MTRYLLRFIPPSICAGVAGACLIFGVESLTAGEWLHAAGALGMALGVVNLGGVALRWAVRS